ncbi:MAG: hypothetical protein OEV10_08925 [Gammaproteobacteria bacterium]|nr:hypothetical protein [Gammaproteobacteria bacterium]
MRVKNTRFALLAAALGTLISLPPAYADEDEGYFEGETTEALSRRLSIGIAGGLMRFDTNFKFTDRETGRSVFLDSEGSMGLPEVKTIPLIYGFWRPSPKHGLGFAYFSVRRDSELVAIDRNFGDLSVEGRASLQDDTRFYQLAYNYTLFQDSRAFLFASLGITAIDLKYDFDAFGVLLIDGEPVTTGSYTENLEQFAPIPMIGLDAWFAITDKWSFGARASFVAGEVSDVRALILESRIRAKYDFNENIGLLIGLVYFDGDVTLNDTDLKTEINYGFEGLMLGLDVGF